MDDDRNAWNNAPACVLGTVCGARRRFGTWRFRSAPCLPIWQVVNAQLCARSTSSHLRRTPTCGYVDNASALPTDPQDQKTTKVSVDLIALKAQHSDPVHHHPDRQPGQPRHPSPHSVPILVAIHTGIAVQLSEQHAHVLTQSVSTPDVSGISDIFQLDAPKVQSTATR